MNGLDIGDGIDSNNEATQWAIDERRKKIERSNKSWWKKNEAFLNKALCLRNQAHCKWLLSPTDFNRTIYKNRAASFQKIVDKAKREEKQGIEKTVNEFFEKKVKGATHLISAKDWWTLVKSIKSIGKPKFVEVQMKLKNPDGTWCKTDIETAEQFAKHFHKVFNTVRPIKDWDKTLASIKQRETNVNLDAPPSFEEIRSAVMRMADGKAAGDNEVAPECFKSIFQERTDENGERYYDDAAHRLVCSFQNFWAKKKLPEDWVTCRSENSAEERRLVEPEQLSRDLPDRHQLQDPRVGDCRPSFGPHEGSWFGSANWFHQGERVPTWSSSSHGNAEEKVGA